MSRLSLELKSSATDRRTESARNDGNDGSTHRGAARNQTRTVSVDGLCRQTEQRDRGNATVPGAKPLMERCNHHAVKPDIADWNFKLKAIVRNQRALTRMNEVERAQDPPPYDQYYDDWRQLAQSHHFQLTMHTECTSLGIVRNQDGPETQRRRTTQCNPQNMWSTLARVIKVLEFDFGFESDLLNRLTSFEVAVEDYKNTAIETLSGSIRSAIMMQKEPKALQNHSLLTVPKEEVEWAVIKKVATDWLLASQSMAL